MLEMAEEHQLPPIVLPIAGLPDLQFESVEQVSEWKRGQSAAWNRLLSAGQNDVFAQWLTTFRNAHTGLEAALNQFSQYRNDPSRHGHFWNQVQNALQIFAKEPWRIAESVEGQELIKLANDDVQAAFFRIGLLSGSAIKVKLQSGADIDAKTFIREVARFSKTWPEIELTAGERLQTVAYVVDGLRTKMSEQLEEHRIHIAEIHAHYTSAEVKLATLTNSFESNTSRLRIAVAKRVRECLKDYKLLNDTYKNHLRLEAPATYWRERGALNLTRSNLSFLVFVMVAAAAVTLFWHYGSNIKAFASDKNGNVQLGLIALISPVVILLIWLFRMISRVFTLSVAEYIDATQRAVMVSTFLALTRDPTSKLSDAERFVILQALFRSSSAKDDDEQIPTNILEMATRFAQGKAT
jgi:hypothetical protein